MTHDPLPPLTGIILEEQAELTLAELCHACSVETTVIVELVDEGVLVPAGPAPDGWRFSGIHLRRATVAVRLQRDLGINVAGVALALELMEEIEALRTRLKVMGG